MEVWPFWDTRANRLAAGDTRSSLKERYGTHAGFVCAVTRAANVAVQQCFLLPYEAPALIANASSCDLRSKHATTKGSSPCEFLTSLP